MVSGPCAAHSLLITAEGKLWSWGEPGGGGHGTGHPKTLRAPRFAAIKSASWPGRNEKGQLGHGDTTRVEAPKLIEVLGGEAIVLAACGRNHTLALTGTARGENPHILDKLSEISPFCPKKPCRFDFALQRAVRCSPSGRTKWGSWGWGTRRTPCPVPRRYRCSLPCFPTTFLGEQTADGGFSHRKKCIVEPKML